MKAALDYARLKKFKTAAEFIKSGLDTLTCDCSLGGWNEKSRQEDLKLFHDVNQIIDDKEAYLFVKAYLLSFEEDKKLLYLALEAAELYQELNDDFYGDYVKGKIEKALGDKSTALKSFEKALQKEPSNSMLSYRVGRTKEELGQFGLDDLLTAFTSNIYSGCCARTLQKYLKTRGRHHSVVFEEEYDDDENEITEEDPLILSFRDSEDEFDFHKLYLQKISSTESFLPRNGVLVPINLLPLICLLERNEDVLRNEDVEEEIEDDYFNDSDFERDEVDYDRDTFDALTDGQYGDYDDWRERGGDFDSLRDSLGH